jgi:hypothetical protein
MTLDSKSELARKKESLDRLRKQYLDAENRNDVDLIKQLKIIFDRLGEQPKVSKLGLELKQHSKNRK